MSKFFLKFCKIATLIIFIPSLAIAGVVFEIDSTDTQTSELLGSTEITVEGSLLKMIFIANESNSALDGSSVSSSATASEGVSASTTVNESTDSEMIYHADREEMVFVDHENKEYFIMSKKSLAEMAEGLGNVAGQMNDIMQQYYEDALEQLDAQDLSPQDRAAAEQALRSSFGMTNLPSANTASNPEIFEVVNLGASSINGYPTTSYEIYLGGEKIKELGVTDWENLGAGAKTQATFESFLSFFDEIRNSFDEMGFGSSASDNFFEHITEIGGFPVVTKSFEGGELEEESVLESVTERDLDPDAFEPPKGYRLRTMGEPPQ